MPALILLGIIFVIGLFIYYLVSTRADAPDVGETDGEEELKKEENVIFLPDDIEGVKKRHHKHRK